jgi:hypothetical protein
VWPGAGLNAYSGFPDFATVNQPPGYQSPYPGGKPGSSPGSSQDAPSSSWYQLESDSYSPFGAVLTGSRGDLIFAISSICTSFALTSSPTSGQCIGNPKEGWDSIQIYIPPGFTVPGPEYVVSTFTNDYSSIYVLKASPYDRYGPGWTVLVVPTDVLSDNSQANTGGSSGSFTPYHVNAINFTAHSEWYYIRVNGVTAPAVAGRYFFKIELMSQIQANYIGGEEGVAGANGNPQGGYPGTGSAGICSGTNCGTFSSNYHGMQVSQFIPTENWPVLLVKGELDPAIITGTIRYAGYNQTLYSQPVKEAGRVYAQMTTRLDPYTGQARPDLPLVDAMGYFNATAQGHYEVEGLAPGIYDLYASAAGYPQTLIASSITILRDQSLHFDGYLQPGAVIHGNVFTKHEFGDEPWPQAPGYCTAPAGTLTNCASYANGVIPQTLNQYIKIELYDGPTVSHIPATSSHMVAWSPTPCVAGGQELYYNRDDAGYCGDPRLGGAIAAPWHEYVPSNGYFSGPSAANFGFYQVATGSNYGTQINKLSQDPQGVGPPQNWYVQGGTTTPFHFEFGVKGEYGAPRDLDGMVPQVYATWVNGLTPGRYYARAWTLRYVQSALDGSTFQEYYFDVTPNEWAGDVTLPIDLLLSSWVNKTVHFHNVINGITEDPIDTGTSQLEGVLVDANGIVWSYNQTLLGYKNKYTTGRLSGSDPYGDSKSAWRCPNSYVHENTLDRGFLNAMSIEKGRANIQFWGFNDTWGGENYGIPSGTYRPHVFAGGYVENSPVELVSVTLSGNPTSVSNHMYRGAGFNITVFSIDWERPNVQRNWVWGNPSVFPESFGFGASYGNQAEGCGINGQPGFPNTYTNIWGGTCLVGQEIDVGFYQNGTLIAGAGDELWNWHTAPIGISSEKTTCLYQNYTSSATQLCGGGWDAQILLPSNQTYVPYEGNSNGAFFGTDPSRVGYVGGYLPGTSNVLQGTALNGNYVANYHPQVIPGTTDAVYQTFGLGYPGLYGTAFPGGLYDLRAYTYGYIQNQPFQVYGMPGQVADSRINLIIGVNVTLDILFKSEDIITRTAANMSARVRLFNEQANLVAEWMSSEGVYAGSRISSPGPGQLKQVNGFATAANGETQFPFGEIGVVPLPQPTNTLTYIPGGITDLNVLMAGLPTIVGRGMGMFDYGFPITSFFGDPASAHTSSGCDFEVGCFGTGYGNPGVNWNNPGYYPNYGILGSSDYQGGWTAEVDFVNWYSNSTGCAGQTWFTGTNFGTNGCNGNAGGAISNSTYFGDVPIYYAPVPGLLMGESFHIIPGTTAKSGISLTEDLALGPSGVGHTMAPNHLGPYSQEGVWQIANAHNSGEASAIWEVDLNGLITGNALAFNYDNEFRTLSWGTVSVTGAGLPSAGLNLYTYDGHYEAYLPGIPAGASGSNTYKITISSPGLVPQTLSIAVSSGMEGTGANIYLQQSNIAVPEFITITIAVFSSLAASVYVLRRRRQEDVN